MSTNSTSHLYHLTGRTRMRQTWSRRIVLVVEYFFVSAHAHGPKCGESYPVYGWRDATGIDLSELASMGASPVSQHRFFDYDQPSDTIRRVA